jgi:hypothetical protein
VIFNLGSKRFISSSNFLKFLKETFDGIKTIKVYKKEYFFYSRSKKEIDSFAKNASVQGFFFDLPRLIIDCFLFVL